MQIVINADDYGRHTNINLGIINAHHHGVVTSASLMVNCEASVEAAQLSSENPNLHVGLHFNISSGNCVTRKDKVPALVDERGHFKLISSSVPTFIGQLQAFITEERQILDQVEHEFWAQVELFRSYGLKISHLDMHHYLSLIHIDMFKKFVELANQLAVPFRGLCYPMLEMLRIPQEIIGEMKAIIHQSNSPTPQISLSNLLGSKPAIVPSEEEYQQKVEVKLQCLANDGVRSVELITHPAIIDDFTRQHDTYLWARELETALVNSASFAHYLDINHFCVIPHASLR